MDNLWPLPDAEPQREGGPTVAKTSMRPAGCTELPTVVLDSRVASDVAEWVFVYHYLRARPWALVTGRFFADNPLVRTAANLGRFLQVSPELAGQVICRCYDRRGVARGFPAQMLARPDLLDTQAGEVYEVKPDTAAGVEEGRGDLRYYACIFGCVYRHRLRLFPPAHHMRATNVKPGTSFDPPEYHLLFPGGNGLPKLWLRMRRAGRGLLLYRFCVEGTYTPAMLPALAKKLAEHREKVRKSYMPATNPAGIGALAREITKTEEALKPLQEAAKEVPAPGPKPVDVYDEIAKRLFTERELIGMFVGLLLLPVVGILLVAGGGLVLGAVEEGGALLVAARIAVGALGRSAIARGFVALASAVAGSEAVEATAGAEEVRTAKNAGDKADGSSRTSVAAGDAKGSALTAAKAEAEGQRADTEAAAALGQAQASATRLQTALAMGQTPAQRAETAAKVGELRARSSPPAVRAGQLSAASVAAVKSAGAAATKAASEARSVGATAVTGGTGCAQTAVRLGKAYTAWSLNPNHAQYVLAPSASGSTGDATARLRVTNATIEDVRLIISPPTCRVVELAAGAKQTLTLAPGPHGLAGFFTKRVGPVAYGSIEFVSGTLYTIVLQVSKAPSSLPRMARRRNASRGGSVHWPSNAAWPRERLATVLRV